MRKRILKLLAIGAALTVVLLVGLGLWVRSQVAGSLPQLDGELHAPGLSAPVVVERDSMGIPTLHAANRIDLAIATGFVHAQDRFFQMDLLRRNSAGELAEIIGLAVLDADRKVRVHRFRDVARRMLAKGTDEDRALVEAYARGVNAGLASLAKKPFEYMLLGEEPAPWQPEDSGLVMFSMYLDLQGGTTATKRGWV
jgi:penicillin amidase